MINRPLYIFDLDGTLALIDHRRPILENLDNPKRWEQFYNECDKDIPNEPIIRIMNALRFLNFEVWIFSGRSETVRDKTIDWLAYHTSFYKHDLYNTLVMREEHNYTPDHILKKSWYDNMLIDDKERLVCVFDDRDRIVKMWRSLGVTCLQVSYGDY